MPRHPEPQPPTEPFAEGGLFRFVQALVAMLIVARWLIPPEASTLGDTLWITQGWMVAAVLWGWDAFRRGDFRIRLERSDAVFWVIVLGHGIATAWVLNGHGNARLALNGFWEWVGLGVLYFLLRQLVRTREESLRLLRICLAVAGLLALHGLWQHYIELPGYVRNYERLTTAVQTAEVQRELAAMGVPSDSVSRTLWENRLRSTEPFATFALANTLAGFLAAWLLLGLDAIGIRREDDKGKSGVSPIGILQVITLLAIAFCLVLTKSRTAWVGLLAGLVTWAIFRRFQTREGLRRWLVGGALLLCLGLAFFAVATFTGGFDREVISEAPKSLKYRLQYWVGSWNVITDHPIVGVGPGNFRPYYLQYKLPEASEEIADPHNWLLDLWTSGGIVAVLGFCGWIAIVARDFRRGETSENLDEGTSKSAGVSAWELGGVLAFFTLAAVRWISGDDLTGRWLCFAVVTGALLFCWKSLTWPRWGFLAGTVALLVHLLGAGGIEMPGVMQIFVVFSVLVSSSRDPHFESATERPKSVIVVTVLAIIAGIACFVTATMPVWYRTVSEAAGDAQFSQTGSFPQSARLYEEAHQADPYSPQPLERLAELYARKWEMLGDDSAFQTAIKWGKRVNELDPNSHRMTRRMGQWYYQNARKTGSESDAATAAKYFAAAIVKYPEYAPLQVEAALAYQLAGETKAAREHAKRAIELDEINRREGHQDKYLANDQLNPLKVMIDSPTPK